MPGARAAALGPIFDRVLDTAGMRALEAAAPPDVDLMHNAGRAVAAALLRRRGAAPARSFVMLIGPGDNGGDALIAAALLADAGASVTAWASRERGDPLADAARARGVRWRVWSGDPDPFVHDVRQADCVVDGLLGIGSAPPLRGAVSRMLAALPQVDGQTRAAIDVPSGVDADVGAADPCAFRASLTLATGPIKLGALLHPAVEFAGEQAALDIGIDAAAYEAVPTALVDAPTVRGLLPARPAGGHKGTFGRLAVVAGSARYRGAAALAVLAALRAGAGLVTLASVDAACAAAAPLAPAATFAPLPAAAGGQIDASARGVAHAVGAPAAVLVGPGLGRSESTDALVHGLLDAWRDLPMVVDADGANALAERRGALEALGRGAVLTPHPGELARLLNLPRAPEGRDRLAAAADLARRTPAVVVAKGSPTFVCANGRVWVLARPNPALAAAGSGDVLAGVIAALLAQGAPPPAAARLGVWLHSRAARLAAAGDDRGVPIESIADAVRPAVNELR